MFDDDDLRLTRKQPNYHFVEWVAAIHLFHMNHVHVLLKKYASPRHVRKCSIIDRILGPEHRQFLRNELEGQPPDLFVFRPDGSEFWFTEVKGPTDTLRPTQSRNHERLRERFGVRVDVIQLKPARDGEAVAGAEEYAPFFPLKRAPGPADASPPASRRDAINRGGLTDG